MTFPTGKPHISYSEVRCWKECPYRHKLKYIDKIDMFKPSPYLDFGTNVHEGCESFINGEEIPREKLIQNIRDAWLEHGFELSEWVSQQPGWYKYYPVDEWISWANILGNVNFGLLKQIVIGMETHLQVKSSVRE